MAQDAFAGLHTEKKLDKIEAYLKAFLTVFKNQSWAQTVYFDAFAGTGEIPLNASKPTLPLDDSGRALISGSVKRALKLELQFNEYIFVEKNRKKAQELKNRLETEHPHIVPSLSVVQNDANDALRSFCLRPGWNKRRAVVFLDPFGSQVSWDTLVALAETGGVDLWYLFPAGMSVHRQISRAGKVHYTHEASLDRLFGTTEWRSAFITVQMDEPDLFGLQPENSVKTATPQSVTKFMVERMGTIFKGGVLDEWIPLGSGKVHMYSLLFACANPNPAAHTLALKLARAVMRSGRNGRPK